MKKSVFFAFLALCWVVMRPAFAANISVPVLELATTGTTDGNLFALSTTGAMDIRIDGGFKFGGKILLGLESEELERMISHEDHSSGMVFLKAASITVQSLLTLPVDLTFFIGEGDTFCSGDDFPLLFGTDSIATEYRGVRYFSDSIRYNGIHMIKGIGFQVQTQPFIPWFRAFIYGYQDAFFDHAGIYSSDLRFLFNFDNFKIEFFTGATYPLSTYGVYRAGLMFYYSLWKGQEFFAQVGIPYWDPADPSAVNQDDFFFLFEPRISFGLFSIIMSLFKHPEYYIQQATHEPGYINLNVKFQVGNFRESPLSGGLESNLGINTSGQLDLQAKIFPYLRIISSGVTWDIRIGAKLFPISLEDIFECYLGIRTEF